MGVYLNESVEGGASRPSPGPEVRIRRRGVQSDPSWFGEDRNWNRQKTHGAHQERREEKGRVCVCVTVCSEDRPNSNQREGSSVFIKRSSKTVIKANDFPSYIRRTMSSELSSIKYYMLAKATNEKQISEITKLYV